MMKKSVIVGQSGGPTAVINASLYGVVEACREAFDRIDRVYGMINGIEGFLQGNYVGLDELDQKELVRLRHTPGAYLGSCRFKLPDDLSDPVYARIFEKLEQLNAGYFLYIGGNDSMDTVNKLNAYSQSAAGGICFVGIPKTIDNDLVLTDHTPGYGSAAKYVAATVREIVLDASVYQKKAVTIVEIMGRHAGWLTAASALARNDETDNPRLIYLPEADFDADAFVGQVARQLEKDPVLVICISEGISDRQGIYLCEYGSESRKDEFGHKMLTGAGKVLERLLKEKLGIKVRSVELNVSQRCSGMLASKTDADHAALAGRHGLSAALAGQSGSMIAFERDGEDNFRIQCVDVGAVCNQEKKFPAAWITGGGTDVSREFLAYLKPLIKGEVKQEMKDGLPVYLRRKK